MSTGLAANSLITMVGTGISALLSVLFLSLGARWLGPAEYGEVAAALAVANVLFLLLNPIEAGLTLEFAGLAGQGRLARLRWSAVRTLRGFLYLAGALLLVWSLACVALEAGVQRILESASFWLGAFCCAAFAACVPRAVLRGREMFVSLSTTFVLESGVRLVAGLVLIQTVGKAPAMVAAYGIAALVSLVHAAVRMVNRLPRPTPLDHQERAPWLPAGSYSTPLLLAHAYAALMLNVDVLAAKHFLPPTEAGLYAGASSIARIVPVAASPLVLVLFSRLASLGAAGADTAKTIRLGATVVVGSASLSLLIPCLVGERVLSAFLGAAFGPAHTVLVYQWSTACVLVAQAFAADAMLATSRVRGAWLLLAPAFVLLCALAVFHASALAIAQTTLLVSATAGTAVHFMIWRQREPGLRSSREPLT